MDVLIELFKNNESVKSVDGFTYTDSKIQDSIRNEPFSLYLNVIAEYKQSISFIAMLHKLVIIDTADDRKYFRKLRNILIHEYLNIEEEILEGFKEALHVIKIKRKKRQSI